MLDRAIGILGIALALIFGLWGLAPEGWPKMPLWLTVLGIGAGVLLFGIAVGMVIADHRNKTEKPNANKFVFEDGPPRIVVSKKRFQNQRVILDDHSYQECIFENVTLVFNGTRPFGLLKYTINGNVKIDSDNPSVSGGFVLLRGVGALGSVDFQNDSGSIIEPPVSQQPGR
jgi:hypothetical protein